ncbi:MAG TPA: TlpA disulfide reductase family protein [Bryobacteraceae bacterium]|jgi:peroxiredoxin|nr:TlpA disulfide reductase family protein [Bryobacteraceae bacterium]
MRTARIDRILQVSIGVLLAVFVYVIFISLYERIVQVGDTAPDFSITADNGQTITPTNFGGKLLVLNFWATWCATCIDELPSLDQFQKQLADSGVVVLGVSMDKDEKTYRRFLSRVNVSFMTARDPANKVNAEYGTYKIPETYIIGKDGRVLMKIISSTNWLDERMLSYVKSQL